MHGGVRLSLRGGGAGPRPGQAPPDAVWEADDETDDEGDEAMTSEQLRWAEVELLEGVAVMRGDDGGQGGVTGGAQDDGDGGTGMEETARGPQLDVLA